MISLQDINIIESLIREGKAKEAEKRLLDLKESKIPRPLLWRVASLARRATLYNYSVKILNPVVRPKAKIHVVASDEEKAEYAASLIRIGAVKEALKILGQLDGTKIPEAPLFKAIGLFTLWEYEKSIPILKQYIESPKIVPYQKAVGKVNLSIAYFFEKRFEEANEVLSVLREETKKENWQLLYGSSLRISAQVAIGQQRWKEAKVFLTLAEEALKGHGGLDLFFVKKWEVILNLLQKGPGKKELEALKSFRKEAEARSHWETIRSLDFYLAKVKGDAEKLIHLYYGSPFGHVRNDILEALGTDKKLPPRYALKLGRQLKRCKELKILEGETVSKSDKLKVGQLRHRLLKTLLSDFYQPFRLAALYSELFPDEYFNPTSSPQRIYQAVHELKNWFKENKVPLEIREFKHSYKLAAKSACSVWIPSPDTNSDPLSVTLRKIEVAFSQEFRLLEASKLLGISPRSTLSLLQKACESGKLMRLGAGPSTRYRFLVPDDLKSAA